MGPLTEPMDTEMGTNAVSHRIRPVATMGKGGKSGILFIQGPQHFLHLSFLWTFTITLKMDPQNKQKLQYISSILFFLWIVTSICLK